jgi:hypothetical protein
MRWFSIIQNSTALFEGSRASSACPSEQDDTKLKKVWSIGGMMGRVSPNYLGWKICPSATLFTTNVTWNSMESNPDLRANRPVTKHPTQARLMTKIRMRYIQNYVTTSQELHLHFKDHSAQRRLQVNKTCTVSIIRRIHCTNKRPGFFALRPVVRM